MVLNILEGKELNRIHQSKEECLYASKQEMLYMMLIDPEVDNIDNKIRAFWFPPYSGAYVELQGKQYTLVNEHILEGLADKDQTFQK